MRRSRQDRLEPGGAERPDLAVAAAVALGEDDDPVRQLARAAPDRLDRPLRDRASGRRSGEPSRRMHWRDEGDEALRSGGGSRRRARAACAMSVIWQDVEERLVIGHDRGRARPSGCGPRAARGRPRGGAAPRMPALIAFMNRLTSRKRWRGKSQRARDDHEPEHGAHRAGRAGRRAGRRAGFGRRAARSAWRPAMLAGERRSGVRRARKASSRARPACSTNSTSGPIGRAARRRPARRRRGRRSSRAARAPAGRRPPSRARRPIRSTRRAQRAVRRQRARPGAPAGHRLG